MSEISATDTSKRFADVLDAVEHRGETFTVVRRGRVVATIAPARRGTGADLRRILSDLPTDDAWADDLRDIRRFAGSGLLAGQVWAFGAAMVPLGVLLLVRSHDSLALGSVVLGAMTLRTGLGAPVTARWVARAGGRRRSHLPRLRKRAGAGGARRLGAT
jgi:antitoxin (DNA-binding transcriptional repressor) of toxin-antitoxin stability system